MNSEGWNNNLDFRILDDLIYWIFKFTSVELPNCLTSKWENHSFPAFKVLRISYKLYFYETWTRGTHQNTDSSSPWCAFNEIPSMNLINFITKNENANSSNHFTTSTTRYIEGSTRTANSSLSILALWIRIQHTYVSSHWYPKCIISILASKGRVPQEP